jgi:nicotinate-nucleotide adenylyltransferase
MTLAIFGGSFDPPHVAHVLAASYALAVGGFERILVVPAFEHALGKHLSPFEERLALCRLCFDDLARVEVSALESELPRPSYTVRLLERLQSERPGVAMRLVIGSDVLGETHSWRDFARIEELAPPFVLTRRGHERPELAPAILPEVSSTRVRELLARRHDAEALRELGWLVPRRVLERIEAANLYASEP